MYILCIFYLFYIFYITHMVKFLSGSYSIWYLRHEEDHIKNTDTFFDYFIKSCMR